MDLKKRIVTLKGKQYAILAGKPTSLPNRSIYLLSVLGKKADYSLWLVEIDDDGEKACFWPYEGPDTEEEEMIDQLMDEFIETAFDE